MATTQVKGLLADGFAPIVFCRFTDTAEYVASTWVGHCRGTTVRVSPGRCRLRSGRAREELSESEGPELVATDCLSEGVNLQERFSAVLHYDLAWNPTRHEQREGRVDRFGQTSDTVRTVTLYGKDTKIDGIVLDVLLRKHEAIRRATGVSVPVPDSSDAVLEALMEGLVLRGGSYQQDMLDIEVSSKAAGLEGGKAPPSAKVSRTVRAAGDPPERLPRRWRGSGRTWARTRVGSSPTALQAPGSRLGGRSGSRRP